MKKQRLFLPIVCSTALIGIVGSVSGTLAWYGISSVGTLTFKGTTVSGGERLQMGINDANLGDDAEIEGLKQADEDGIYWSGEGGGLFYNTIQDYLSQKGYASGGTMQYCGSTHYDDDIANNPLSLYKMPRYQIGGVSESSLKEDYAVLPLAIRVIDLDASNEVGENVYKANQEIYLSEIEASIEDSASELINSLRVEFLDQTEPENKGFIMKPSDTTTDGGETLVGGFLDVNKDGYVDVEKGFDYGDGLKEVIYGDYEGTPVDEEMVTVSDEIPQDYDYPIMPTTLYHQAYSVPQSGVTFLTQKWHSAKEYLTTFGEDGQVVSGKPILTTNEYGIALLQLTIWLEGWDESVIDKNADELSFKLGLKFEIER